MAFPRTVEELREAGYKYLNHSHCRGCGQLIQWWETPRERKIPIEIVAGKAVAHWTRCPMASEFRKT